MVQVFTKVFPAELGLYGSPCSLIRPFSLFGGLVFATLWAASSPAVAAQVAADEAVVSDEAVTEVPTAESQPTWTFERLVSEVAARNPRIRSQSAAASAAGYDVAAARWQFFRKDIFRF